MIERIDIERTSDAMAEAGLMFPWSSIDTEKSWMFLRDGVPVVAAGLDVAWPGFAQTWAIFDEENVDVRWIVREWKSWLEMVIPEYNLRQLRHFAGSLKAIRLAELVGYEMECVWADAGPAGEDIFIMVYHRRN